VQASRPANPNGLHHHSINLVCLNWEYFPTAPCTPCPALRSWQYIAGTLILMPLELYKPHHLWLLAATDRICSIRVPGCCSIAIVCLHNACSSTCVHT
jgi:hypothetical protein